MKLQTPLLLLLGTTWALAACTTPPSPSVTTPTVTGYQLYFVSGSAQVAVGDAVRLGVVETLSDNSTASLPSGATVAFSGPNLVTADASGSTLPATGSAPVALMISNPARSDRASDLTGTVFALDAGTSLNQTVTVTAAISSGGAVGSATQALTFVAAAPQGRAGTGATTYGANCASCHGSIGQGGVGPTLNATTSVGADASGIAADPSWNAAMLAMASRADVDNEGVPLASPMPDWLTRNAASGSILTGQDYADILAYLQTQGL